MATLASLPDEMKLEIGLYIQTTSIEIFLNSAHQAACEVNTPEWKGLYSYQISSPALIGPATDAIAAARSQCDTIAINLFRREDVSRRIMTSIGLGAFKKVAVTVPLHYTREVDPTKEDTEEAFISCTMTFTQGANGAWTCADSDCTEEILSSNLYDDPHTHPDYALRFLGMASMKANIRHRARLGLSVLAGGLSRQHLFLMTSGTQTVFERHIQTKSVEGSWVGYTNDNRAFTCASPWNAAGELIKDPPKQEYYRRGGGWIRQGSSLTRDPAYMPAAAVGGQVYTLSSLTGPM